METKEVTLKSLMESDDAVALFNATKPFQELMMKYECALKEVETKFNVLNCEFSVRNNRNPVESIKTRIKQPVSIVEKIKRRNFEMSVKSIKDNLNDVAGIRIICSFIDDIYFLADMFARQDDIKIVEVKDYIQNPKENGYRSLHLIVEVPIFLSNSKEYMRVEVQFRTIAMDFWASLDHKLKYKRNLDNADAITQRLKNCADSISLIDKEMHEIRCSIDDSSALVN